MRCRAAEKKFFYRSQTSAVVTRYSTACPWVKQAKLLRNNRVSANLRFVMYIAITRETYPDERRISMVPASVKRLVERGASVAVESGAGLSIGISDEAYLQAGATIADDRARLLGTADMILSLRVSGPRIGSNSVDMS